MSPTILRPTRSVIALGLALALLPLNGSPRSTAQAPDPPTNGPSVPGQSATLLPDGRWLFIGGERDRGAVFLRDTDTGAIVRLRATLRTPRAWHTATLLADGSVLVLGGVAANGDVVAAPERFQPGAQTFEPLLATGFAPRARHTATLLTDGGVLVAGGEHARVLDDAELFDPSNQLSRPVGSILARPRAGHVAQLLADGRVLITGGEGAGSGARAPEVFDPQSNRFEPGPGPFADASGLYITAANPGPGTSDVPVDAIVRIRWSRPLDVRSVSEEHVILTGPDGAIPVARIPAESGRLLFLSPLAPLRAGSDYTVTLRGLRDPNGLPSREVSWSFTTKKEPEQDQQANDEDEVWRPGQPSGWRVGDGVSPWQMLPPLTAAPGVTALAGQVLRLNGRPLADVTLSVAGREARSDTSGRFLLLLPGVPTGRQQLEIKGGSASRPGRTYGFFEAGLTIVAGQTTVLPYTIWMPRLDTVHTVRIPSPTTRETVITTPFIPGLEVHVPPGTVITDEDGRIVRELGITPIPVDRPPFPLPAGVEVPIYFTIQPGGAYVHTTGKGARGARVIYPNYYGVPSGVIANFWHYDPDENDWYVYGAGVVKGSQVVPNPGVAIYKFTGAMFNNGNTPPQDAPRVGGGPTGGDPVDLATGLFVLQTTDLALPDVLPISLHRTYRPADPATRPFGIGAMHDYAMFLWSAQQFQQVDLVLPDGGRVHYVRISPGNDYVTAEFEHTSSPTRFYKSRITWNGMGWDLKLRDGTVYAYAMQGPLQTIRDRYGNTIRLSYATVGAYGAGYGDLLRVESPNGRWIAFTYDASHRITEAVDNSGRTVGYQYDASGRLWKVTDVAGGVTEYTYDASHRLLTIKDPRSIVYLTNQYDANNRVTLQTQADATTYQFTYALDGNGRVTQADVTNPRGHVTRTTFNAAGYATSTVEARGLAEERTTTYIRDGTSQRVTSTTDPLGRETDDEYDANGNVTSVTRLAGTPEAVTTTMTYESAFDQLASVTDPHNHTTTFAYDALGRLTTITDPLSHQTTLTYNAAGQPVTISNDLNETVTLGYDRGDLVSVVSPMGETTTRFLDAAGRLLRVTDPAARSTQYAHGSKNEVTSITDPLGGHTTFTYDGNLNVLALTDANAHTTTWTYDDMDRVETRIDPLTRTESYLYDENANLAQLTDRKGQVTTYDYDALDRLVLTTYHDNSTTGSTYDAGDRTTEIADSVGGTITRTYDRLDRLTAETTPEGTVAYSYDAASRRATMDVSGQSQMAYAYDDANRLTSITQGTSVVSFAYDAANRRTSLTLPNGIVTEYRYDAASQLTSLTYKLSGSPIGDLTYTYDAAGQRTSVGGSWARTNLPAALTSASYDTANQIAMFNGVSMSYDANGNLTSDGMDTYTWNARNQLIGITGTVSASFGYDGRGRRRSVSSAGGVRTFLYDCLNVVEEFSGGSPAATALAGPQLDEVLSRTETSTRFFLRDVIGSTTALADASGTLQTQYTYDPFGKPVSSGAPDANPFQYTTRENDGAGLYFLRARYFSPTLARFVSEDPSGLAPTPNVYAYAGNAPTMYVDPLGLSAKPIFNGGASGGAGASGGWPGAGAPGAGAPGPGAGAGGQAGGPGVGRGGGPGGGPSDTSPSREARPKPKEPPKPDCAGVAARAFSVCIGAAAVAMAIPLETGMVALCASSGPVGFIPCMVGAHEAAAPAEAWYLGVMTGVCTGVGKSAYNRCTGS